MVRLLARLLVLVALLAPGLARADAFSSTAPSPPGVANVNGQVQTQAYDGTIQFSFGIVPGATEYWNGLGGLTGTGGTLYATNGNPAGGGSVNGNFVTQGAGSFFFATGAGTAFRIADPGAAATNFLTVTPGTAAANPLISSSVNAQIDGSAGSANAGSGFGVVLSYGGIKQAVAAPIGAGTPSSVAWIQFGNSSGDSSGHISCLGATNTSCFFTANGTGTLSLANSSGTQVTFANSSANTAVSGMSVRAASTTQPVLLQTINTSANIAAGGGAGAMTALATTATTGHFGIPTVSGVPTGVPVDNGSGAAFILYNPSTHNLNIYDNAAASWYHVALTAGGG